MKKTAESASALLRGQRYGVLTTQSLAVPGYPFGSLTPYVLSDEGNPTILISTLAQHTQNIRADNRVCLTVFDPRGAEDIQATARLSWFADARPVAQTALSAIRPRYNRYFPSSLQYNAMSDFSYYELAFVNAHYVGGFGVIHWLDKGSMATDNWLAEAESRIVNHMNADHADALMGYCRYQAGIAPTSVTMIGIDQYGFDLLADDRPVRIPFESPVTSADAAHTALVQMAQRVR
jgi:putative heme iron utilization protein